MTDMAWPDRLARSATALVLTGVVAVLVPPVSIHAQQVTIRAGTLLDGRGGVLRDVVDELVDAGVDHFPSAAGGASGPPTVKSTSSAATRPASGVV